MAYRIGDWDWAFRLKKGRLDFYDFYSQKLYTYQNITGKVCVYYFVFVLENKPWVKVSSVSKVLYTKKIVWNLLDSYFKSAILNWI